MEVRQGFLKLYFRFKEKCLRNVKCFMVSKKLVTRDGACHIRDYWADSYDEPILDQHQHVECHHSVTENNDFTAKRMFFCSGLKENGAFCRACGKLQKNIFLKKSQNRQNAYNSKIQSKFHQIRPKTFFQILHQNELYFGATGFVFPFRRNQ